MGAFSKRLLLAAALTAGAPATAGTLGIAAQYNEFILGNVDYKYSDVQGKIAVGGNLTVTGTSLADKMGTNTTNVVVGGNFTATNGSVKGNIVAGGNVNYNNPTVNGNVSAGGSVTFNPNGGGSVGGSVTYGSSYAKPSWMNPTATQGITTVPVDFNAQFQYLRDLSAAQVDADDPYGIYQWSQLFFNGTDPGINVFNVTETMFETAYGGFHFNAPSGSTVVVNVPGTDIRFLNTGFDFRNVGVDHLVWNFYEATSLTFDGSSHGTILAPKAAVMANYGGLNGNLIAASMSGAGGGTSLEAHIYNYGGGANTLFSGTLRDIPVVEEPQNPGTTPVSEAGTIGLLAFGLAALGLRLRKA